MQMQKWQLTWVHEESVKRRGDARSLFCGARGMTLLEIVASIGITMMIAGLIFASFSNYRTRQNMDGSIETVMAVLSRAHVDTISSKNDDVYGVYFNPAEVIYFRGATYPGDSDPANVHYILPPTIEIANVSFHGDTQYVIFNKLSGTTENYGTFDVRSKADTSITTTLTVNKTGATSF
jgi:type II secretory pathway pseudopilin PulG